VLWAALHGLITLDRGGRPRPDHRAARIDLLIAGIAAVSLVTPSHIRGHRGVLGAEHPREQEILNEVVKPPRR
jgi:hypothetical protein